MKNEYNRGTFFLSHEIEYMTNRDDDLQRTSLVPKHRFKDRLINMMMNIPHIDAVFVHNHKDRSSVIWVIEDSVGVGTLNTSEGKITYNCQRNSIDPDIFNEHFLS
jgi:hypothetical protein